MVGPWPSNKLATMPNVTHLLEAAHAGDRRAAADLLPLVYEELRKLAAARMAGESPDHTLEPTATQSGCESRCATCFSRRS